MAKKNGPKAAKRGKPEKPRRAKKKRFPVFKTILVVILAFAVLLGLGGALFYATVELPNPNEEFTTQTTTLYYDDGKTELGRLAIQNREAIAYDQMPDSLKDAVVAAEDRSFWSNQGIDLLAWPVLRSESSETARSVVAVPPSLSSTSRFFT